MPLYNYLCHVCDEQEEEFVHKKNDEVLCLKCGNKKHRLFPLSLGPINFGFPEGGVTMEHVGPTPVHFETRQQAKRYAKEHNVDLGCL